MGILLLSLQKNVMTRIKRQTMDVQRLVRLKKDGNARETLYLVRLFVGMDLSLDLTNVTF